MNVASLETQQIASRGAKVGVVRAASARAVSHVPTSSHSHCRVNSAGAGSVFAADCSSIRVGRGDSRLVTVFEGRTDLIRG